MWKSNSLFLVLEIIASWFICHATFDTFHGKKQKGIDKYDKNKPEYVRLIAPDIKGNW